MSCHRFHSQHAGGTPPGASLAAAGCRRGLRGPAASSLALKSRLALLVEGAHALFSVFGADELVVGLDLEAIAGEEIHLQAVVHRLLRLAHCERGISGDS